MPKKTARPPRSSTSRTASRKKAPKVVTPEVLEAEVLDAEDEELDGDLTEEGDQEIEPSDDDGETSAIATIQPEALTLDSEARAISPTDPLKRYFDEVKRYPLLDPKDELKYALEMQNGSVEAARRLVQANLRLVVKIAFEYRSVYANVMDLIQEGNLGLMKAVTKFDPTKGARLGYYASWWIRSYILKYLLDNFRLVRIGTTQAQKKLFFHLMREKEKLEAQGVFAGPKLLADRLDVREKDVVEMEKRLSSGGGEVSLDSPVSTSGERSASYVELLKDEKEGTEDRLAREQLLKLLSHRLPEFRKTLNDKEKRLLDDRLLAEEPKTLQEIADQYHLTRERARQIEAKVIEKLREFLRPALKE